MLRRRRSLAGPPVAEKPSPGSRNKGKSRRAKDKMSPYPEVKGAKFPLRQIDNSHGSKFTGLKMVLEFDDLMEENANSISVPTGETAVHDTGDQSRTKATVSKTVPAVASSNEAVPVIIEGVESSSEAVPVITSDEKQVPSGNLRPGHVLALDRKLSPCMRGHVEHFVAGKESLGEDAGRKRKILNASTARVSKAAMEEPSAQTRGVWDSVVSWMKMAVDYIALDGTTEALPGAVPHGKKRSLADSDFTNPLTMKQPRLSNKRCRKWSCDNGRGSVGGRGKSFGGFVAPTKVNLSDGLGQVLAMDPIKEETFHSSTRRPIPFHFGSNQDGRSPTSQLATNLTNSLSIKSPLDESKKPVKTGQKKLKSTQHFESTHFGLNSILDGSPKAVPVLGPHKKRIRRQSLRCFSGNSVNSPNLTEVPSNAITVRRSPRLNGIPPAPPPPPVPCAPPLPPPIPTPRKAAGSEVNPSLEILSKMQSRLRCRMKKKPLENGAGLGGVAIDTNNEDVDIKVKQWGEIQARCRKLSYADFLSLAKQKKAELEKVLRGLEEGVPSSVREISEIVEVLQEGALWVPGGSKEMRESIPLYKTLERKVETLNEFIQVSKEMRESSEGRGKSVLHSDLHATLLHIREEFDTKHRHWGTIIASNAESWVRCGLPACHALLARSRGYLCDLVGLFVSLCLKEAANLTGILVSIKCVRTTQLKEKLRECLRLMIDAHSYFTSEVSNSTTCSCELCTSELSGLPVSSSECHSPCVHVDCDGKDSMYLLSLAVQVVVSYVNIALQQFEGFVAHSNRQGVCEHFEGVLKMLSQVKSLVVSLPSTEVVVLRSTGILALLPDGEELGGALYSSCVMLIQHIMGRQHGVAITSPSSKERVSKEMVLWMMFSCKYVNHILEFLGSEQASQRGVVNLLGKLQEIEEMLPDY